MSINTLRLPLGRPIITCIQPPPPHSDTVPPRLCRLSNLPNSIFLFLFKTILGWILQRYFTINTCLIKWQTIQGNWIKWVHVFFFHEWCLFTEKYVICTWKIRYQKRIRLIRICYTSESISWVNFCFPWKWYHSHAYFVRLFCFLRIHEIICTEKKEFIKVTTHREHLLVSYYSTWWTSHQAKSI